MRVALINGSPKFKDSTSAILLDTIKELFDNRCEIAEFHFNKTSVSDEDLEKLKDSGAIIFAFPLYIDGIPGHLLSCLEQIDKAGILNRNVYIYGICNCGFYEGIQTDTALNILRNWSCKAGSAWGGGIGVGGGGCITLLPKLPVYKGPKASIDKELKVMTDNVICKVSQDNRYTNVNMPRFAYKQAAQFGWRQKIKANGLTVADLGRKL